MQMARLHFLSRSGNPPICLSGENIQFGLSNMSCLLAEVLWV
jgi:hypothetical protein